MLTLLIRLRFYLIAGGLFLAVVGGLIAYARHEHGRAEKAQARAEAATRQAQLDRETAQSLDTYTQQSARITERTHEITRTIKQAPGADTPIPAPVLDAWRSGLRNQTDQPSDHPSR